MRARDAVLFDLDGTLTDPKRGICGCVQYALRELGLTAPTQDELEWVIGPPMIESLRTLVGPARAEDALRLYRARYGETGLFENEVYPGVVDMLAEVAASGARMFVATSKAEPYAQRIVAHFGLSRYFERVYGSGLDGSLLHKDALLAFALADAAIDAARAIMIGDRNFDVNGARANGVDTIGVGWGYGSRDELLQAGAITLVDSPRDLPLALARLRA